MKGFMVEITVKCGEQDLLATKAFTAHGLSLLLV
jgi:hypothetical protein